MTQETWSSLKGLVTKQLSGKRLFVVDGFCGASEQDRIAVRIVPCYQYPSGWLAHPESRSCFFHRQFSQKQTELSRHLTACRLIFNIITREKEGT